MYLQNHRLYLNIHRNSFTFPTSVDGGYSSWSAWGRCSVTCGGGSQGRARSCSNPAPQYGGKACGGSASQTQSCNTHNCPSMYTFYLNIVICRYVHYVLSIRSGYGDNCIMQLCDRIKETINVRSVIFYLT